MFLHSLDGPDGTGNDKTVDVNTSSYKSLLGK
jgi:hypothetical protein